MVDSPAVDHDELEEDILGGLQHGNNVSWLLNLNIELGLLQLKGYESKTQKHMFS